jgi:hypothetical protein
MVGAVSAGAAAAALCDTGMTVSREATAGGGTGRVASPVAAAICAGATIPGGICAGIAVT